MSAKTFVAAILLAGVVAALVWQRNALARLRQQNVSFRAQMEEADRLATENRDLPKLRVLATSQSGTPTERAELLRLRNEVRQLRARKQEVDKLRTANQRLTAEIKSGNIAPRKLSEMEGYVAKETWANAGFATPEATVQTFLWSISAANFDRFVQCMSPNDARHFQRQAEQYRKEIFGEENPFRKMNGFRIAERTTMDENNVQLGVQAAAGGQVFQLHLRRFGQEWKIQDL